MLTSTSPLSHLPRPCSPSFHRLLQLLPSFQVLLSQPPHPDHALPMFSSILPPPPTRISKKRLSALQMDYLAPLQPWVGLSSSTFNSLLRSDCLAYVPYIRCPKGNAAEMIARKLESKIRDAILMASRSHHGATSSTAPFAQDSAGLSNLQRPRKLDCPLLNDS